MPKPETLAAIDVDWAENFGCPVEQLHSPGITLLANAGDFAEYSGAYLLRWEDGSAVLTAPAPSFAVAEAGIHGRSLSEVFDCAFLAQLFGRHVDRIIGPASRNCADETDFRLVDACGTRQLTLADDAALHRLAAACDAEEWEHSGISFDRPPTFGCFVGDELAAAGMLHYNGLLRNIGIVTHPAYRRQGYGRAVVSAMTAHALGESAIPHYQALLANTGSLAIARSLGFVRYAMSLAVRLRPRL